MRALRAEMAALSERQQFERAAAVRDKIRAIERTMESQKMAAFARVELDLLGIARQDNQAAVALFVIRDGKMIGRDVYLLEAAREASDDEVLASFLEQYYARATSIPREVYVPASVGESADIQAFLAERRGGPVHLRVPQRGEKRELMELAQRNAAEHLAREQARWLADQGKTLAALEQLAEALGLASIAELARRGGEQAKLVDRAHTAVASCARTLRELSRALDALEREPAAPRTKHSTERPRERGRVLIVDGDFVTRGGRAKLYGFLARMIRAVAPGDDRMPAIDRERHNRILSEVHFAGGARAEAVADLLRKAGFTDVVIDRDLRAVRRGQGLAMPLHRRIERAAQDRYAISAMKPPIAAAPPGAVGRREIA